jgi:hypothetical protein
VLELKVQRVLVLVERNFQRAVKARVPIRVALLFARSCRPLVIVRCHSPILPLIL